MWSTDLGDTNKLNLVRIICFSQIEICTFILVYIVFVKIDITDTCTVPSSNLHSICGLLKQFFISYTCFSVVEYFLFIDIVLCTNPSCPKTTFSYWCNLRFSVLGIICLTAELVKFMSEGVYHIFGIWWFRMVRETSRALCVNYMFRVHPLFGCFHVKWSVGIKLMMQYTRRCSQCCGDVIGSEYSLAFGVQILKCAEYRFRVQAADGSLIVPALANGSK